MPGQNGSPPQTPAAGVRSDLLRLATAGSVDDGNRYFATPRRKFIIADTPGHIQYTRNMVTGASTADLAVILVDARNGVVEQTRRHAYIASILRVPHITVAINKMDLVDWSQERFDEIVRDVESLKAGSVGGE